MAGTIDLDALGEQLDPNYRKPVEDAEAAAAPPTWGDYGRAALSGAYGVVGGLAAAGQYVTGAEEDSALAGARRWAEEGSDAQIKQMSPRAQRALGAGILPGEGSMWSGDVDKGSAIGLKLASASPSLLAGILPGGIVAGAVRGAAGAAAGMVASGAVNGALMGGQVFEDIQKGILDSPDDTLRQQSPVYAEYRDMGFDEGEAKRRLVEAAAGYKPVYMAALGLAMERFGAGAAAAKAGAGTLEKGVVGSARQHGVEEAWTEALQNATQEGFTQTGNIEAGTQQGYEPGKIAEQAVQGGVIGGLMGGAVGGAAGVRGHAPAATPDLDAIPAAPKVQVLGQDNPVAADAAAAIRESTAQPAAPEPAAPVLTARDEAQAALDDADKMLQANAQALEGAKGEQARATGQRRTRSKRQPKVVEGVPPAEAVAIQEHTRESTPDPAPVEAPSPQAELPPAPVAAPEPDRVGGDQNQLGGDVEPARAAPAAEPPRDVPAAFAVGDGLEIDPDVELPAPAPRRTQRVVSASAEPSTPELRARAEAAQQAGTLADAAVRARTEPVAQQAVTPVEQPASTPVTPPVTPEPVEAAAVPSTTLEPVPAATTEAPQPRVLQSQDAESVKAEKAWKAKSKEVAKTAAQLEGTAPAVEGRIRSTDFLKPEVLRGQTEKSFLRRARENAEGGPAYYAAAVQADDARKGLRGEARQPHTAAIEQARQQEIADAEAQHAERAKVAEKATTASDTGHFDDAAAEAQTQKQLARQQKAAALAELNEKAKTALLSVEPTKTEERALIGSQAGKEAIATRLRQILQNAQDAGVAVPNKARADTPPYVRALTNAKVALGQIEAGKFTPARARDFITSHTLERAGETKVGRAVREEEAARTLKGEGQVQTKDGDDVARGTGEALADAGPNPEERLLAKDEAEDAPAEPVVARERPKVVVDVEKAVTAGADKAGTFKVEPAKGRRKFEIPKKPAAEAVKAVSQQRSTPAEQPAVTPASKPKVDPREAERRAAQDAHDRFIQERIERRNREAEAAREARKQAEAERQRAIESTPRKELKLDREDDPEVHPGVVENVIAPRNALRRFANSLSDADYAHLRKTFGASDFYGFPQLAGTVSDKESADKVLGAWKRTLEERDQKPAALQPRQEGERERLLRELAALDAAEGVSEHGPGAAPITDARTGISLTPRTTTSLRDTMAGLSTSHLTGAAKTIDGFIQKRLRETVGDVPVHVISSLDMVGLTQDLIESGHFSDVPHGMYDPASHAIYVRDDIAARGPAFQRAVIHEGMHAALMHTINRNPGIKRLIKGLMDHVVAHDPEAARYYGLENEHEFVSEAFSNAEFQDLLARIPAPKNFARDVGFLGNVWQHFVITVRKALGLPAGTETMLDATMRAGAHLFRLREAAVDPAARPAALLPSRQEVTEAGKDRAAATAGHFWEKVLKVGTLDQIAQADSREHGGARFFPKPDGGSYLDDLRDQVQRIEPLARQYEETLTKHAQNFLELRRTDKASADASAALRMDITRNDVNLLPGQGRTLKELLAANEHLGKDAAKGYQAKARILDLQRRFEALPEPVREQMFAEAKDFRATQNAIARLLAGNILDLHRRADGTTFTAAERDGLITRTLAGTLTQEDRDLVNDTAIWNALLHAKELKTLKGMYFPMMRNGDFVVKAKDHLKPEDLMGGREVERGVVEFRAATDKEARKAFKAFVEQTPYDQINIAKTYYDQHTGERLRAMDAIGQDVDVAYRVTLQLDALHAFDSRAEAEKFARENPEGYHEVSEVMRVADRASRGDLTGSQLAALMNSIEQRPDISEPERARLKTAMGQAAMMLMSGNRIQHRSLPRRKVMGAESEDFARVLVRYASAASRYRARLTYMPAVQKTLRAMRAHQKEMIMQKDAGLRSAILEEIGARVDSNMTDVKQPPRWLQDALTVSHLSKLASLGHSIVNLTQPGMVTFPVLAGRYGAAKSAGAIARAYNTVGGLTLIGQGLSNTAEAIRRWHKAGLDTSDLIGSIRGKLAGEADGAELGRVMDLLVARGALSDGAEFELARPVAEGRGVWGHTLARTDRIARQLPAAIEAINRTTTAVAAYRLARESGMPEAAAAQHAFDTVQNTQGDYSAGNAPPLFQKPLLRPFFQFKKYAQMMSYLFYDMTYRAFRGASPEEKKVALKQLGNLAAVQVAMAGALSLPGLELVKLGAMAAAALGFGGGYDDIERKARRIAEESLGKTWGTLVTKGVVSRALGVDLSSRLSLNDGWVYGEPRQWKRSELAGWLGQQIIGAPGSTGLDILDAARALGDGDYVGAAIKALPVKQAADIARAYKGYDDGKMSLGEAALLGTTSLRTGRYADAQAEVGARIAENDARTARRTKLMNAYVAARTAGERAKALSAIRAFNAEPESNFRSRINPKSLDKRREQNARERAALQ